ncbi:cytochrome P450 2C20-like [Mytilus californianus]|uniref:cytochrome P450 2C20-like n=1 Tax=Mytilus californianus TaxID=6549 RepID=UPI002245F263|nr:cytochrome P450 2C20-like [Mytilus californianus]
MDGVSLTLVILIVLLTFLWIRSKRPGDLPPGPTPLPLIGNIPALFGGDLLKVSRNLRKQYGDLYSLSLGPYWIVFVNGYDLLKEAFVKNADVLSDRPDTFSIKVLSERRGIVSSNGHRWKGQRTFALAALRAFGFGKRSMETKILEENKNFIEILEKENGKPMGLAGLINRSVSNVICSITVGKTFSYDDEGFTQAVNLVGEEISNPYAPLVDMLPFLQYVPGDMFLINRSFKNKAILEQAVKEEIEEHKQTLDENDARDFIDAFLLEEMKHKEEEGTDFEDDQLQFTILDLFAAGTETTSTTITWAVLFLMQNMDIQEKMHEEIENVVGSNRQATLSDKTDLPYCNAVITETQRLGNIVPLSLFHMATEDLVLENRRIPKGAIVIPVLDSVQNDENNFPNPEKFDPTRFINNEGKYCNQDKIMPFSLGRRVCLGESLARMELFLFLTSMVQKFKFLPPQGEQPPTAVGSLGITHGPLPFNVRCVPW